MSKQHKHNPQKYRWTKKKVFDSFEKADELRNALKEKEALVKVRRCGPAGTKFKVVVGSEIKTDKKKKGEKNATK
jgi:hypothetical protein